MLTLTTVACELDTHPTGEPLTPANLAKNLLDGYTTAPPPSKLLN